MASGKRLAVSVRWLLVWVCFYGVCEAACALAYRVRHGRAFWPDKATTWAQAQQPPVRFTPYGLLEYRPYATPVMQGYPAVLSVDRYGLIHNGVDVPLQPEAYTIVILGGSTVEGRGATANAQTIPARLQALLQARLGVPVQVLNAAFPSHNSYQQLGRLEGWARHELAAAGVKPSLVVALDGRNDAFYVAAYADTWRANWQPYYDLWRHDINRVQAAPTPVALRAATRWALWFPYHSAFAHTLQELVLVKPPSVERFAQATPATPERIEAAAHAYAENQAAMRLRTEGLGAHYAAFLQPTLLPTLKGQRTPEEHQAAHDWQAAFVRDDIYEPAVEAFYRAARRRMAGRADWSDLSEAFSDAAERMYWDSCHYTDTANDRLATILTDALEPTVRGDLQKLNRG